MTVIIAAVFLAVQEDTEKKICRTRRLWKSKEADLQANLREIDRKLADEQRKAGQYPEQHRGMHPGSGRW